jgi:predicted nucleic acid-binding protein
MTVFVVDSNTVVKWFVAEELAEAARRVLSAENVFVAPDFMPAEVVSALLRKYRRGHIQARDVILARESIRDAFELVTSEPFLDEALSLAIPHQRSAYDSTYVVIARDRGCQMVTADRKLYDAIAPVYPRTMLWVEDIPA